MLAVTGLIHGGTSPLARIAHQVGCLMGESMMFPIGGDCEWEDRAFSQRLIHLQMEIHWTGTRKWRSKAPSPSKMKPFFREYIGYRRAHLHQQQELFQPLLCQTWGVKSPLLCLYKDVLAEVCSEMGEELIWAAPLRPIEEVNESLNHEAIRLGEAGVADTVAFAKRQNVAISKALEGFAPCYSPTLEEIRNDPATVAADLRVLLDLVPFPGDPTLGIRPLGSGSVTHIEESAT